MWLWTRRSSRRRSRFRGTLPAGPVKLKIAYTGILNDKLRGFYLSKADGAVMR